MLLFPERDGKLRERKANPATDRKARAIAMAICKRQQAAAAWLGRKFDALPLHIRKLCLLLFCLSLGGASGWILARTVLPGPTGLQHVVPSQAKDPATPPWGAHSTLPQKKFRHRLQRQPDSLRHTNRHDHLPTLK